MFIGEKPDLLDLCVFREDSIYVVGKDGIPHHYDGEWTPETTENANPLMGIWGPNENCIYAVGIGGVVLHYDGKKWNQIDTGNYDSLNSAFGFNENCFFIFGVGGRMLFWDCEWNYREPNTIHDLFCMWGEDLDCLHTVGGEGVYRVYNGSTFERKEELTSEEISLYGVWGSRKDNVFIAGSHGTILRSQGEEWESMESGTEEYLLSVWGTGDNDIFAVGDCGVILHFDGERWSPMDSGTENYLTKVKGLGPNQVYAVGDNGCVLRYDGKVWHDMSL